MGPAGQHKHEVHFEPLRWIGAYKLLKGALAIIGGLLVLRLMHRDLPALAIEWLNRLRIEPHSKLGQFVLRNVLHIRHRNLQVLAVSLFVYVPISIVEGLGLIFRKLWAEWLTVVVTAALIPWEVYEIIRHATAFRISLLLLNVLVVAYLVYRIGRDRRHHVASFEVVPQSGFRAKHNSSTTLPPNRCS